MSANLSTLRKGEAGHETGREFLGLVGGGVSRGPR